MSQNDDVRMRGFQHRTDVASVLRLLAERLLPLPGEDVDLHQAAGRVLAQDVIAPCDVPGFDRAAMDGFAVFSSVTQGAQADAPLEFDVLGDALPGRAYVGTLWGRHAIRIMTGAPIPSGADAVVPVEVAVESSTPAGRKVRISAAVQPGRHVGRRGEDVTAGSIILSAGRVLRPQDVGVLASVGASPIQVIRRPTVAILVTGDELLPCGSRPEGYRIVDSNSVMLEALLHRDRVATVRIQMVSDRFEDIRHAVVSAAEDVLLITGGSSVGVEDHTPRVLAEVGELTIHGIALRPAAPTGVGFVPAACGQGKPERPVFLMPGNPVSCLCAYDLFAGPAVRRLGGRSMDQPHRRVQLPLARAIASVAGRTDYVRVLIREGKVEPLATSGAAILTSTTRADGFVLVPAELAECPEGSHVEVFLFE